MTREDQLRRLSAQTRVKAQACRELGRFASGLDCRNWNGLAEELDDLAWGLEELASGRDVEALAGPEERVLRFRQLRAARSKRSEEP